MNLQELKKIYFILEDLQKISRQILNLNIAHCNYGLSKWQETRWQNLAKQAAELAGHLNCKVEILTDPRYNCGICLYEGEDFWKATNKLYI